MKKNLSGKIAVLMFLLAAVGSVMFGATLTISGTIDEVLTVTIDGVEDSTYTGLDLTTSQTLLVVGTSNHFSNITAYELTISSANGGQLQIGTATTNVVPYTVSYGDLSDATLTVAPQIVLTTPNITATTGDELDIAISYDAVANNFPADTYSDVLTIVIAAL